MQSHPISFIIFGIALLTPWNVWIQIHELLDEKLVDTPYRSNFEGVISITYQMGNFAVLLVLLSFRYFASINPSLRFRVVVGLWLLLMVFSVATLTLLLNLEGKLFSAILVLVSISALSGALLSSFIALASSFPPASMTYLSTGQGIAALLPSISQFISPFSPGTNVIIVFCQSILVGLGSLVAFNRLLRLQQNQGYQPLIDDNDDEIQLENQDLGIAEDEENATHPSNETAFLVFKNIHLAATSVFLNLFITLSLFPAITASVEYDYSRLALLHFVIYNFSDLIGKYCTLYCTLIQKNVFILSVGRLVFFPLLLMCNVTLRNADGIEMPHYFPRVFNLYEFLVILVLFGFSNGYLTAASFVNSGSLLQSPTIANYSTSGDLMQFFLTIGLTLGSFFTFFVQKIV